MLLGFAVESDVEYFYWFRYSASRPESRVEHIYSNSIYDIYERGSELQKVLKKRAFFRTKKSALAKKVL